MNLCKPSGHTILLSYKSSHWQQRSKDQLHQAVNSSSFHWYQHTSLSDALSSAIAEDDKQGKKKNAFQVYKFYFLFSILFKEFLAGTPRDNDIGSTTRPHAVKDQSMSKQHCLDYHHLFKANIGYTFGIYI